MANCSLGGLFVCLNENRLSGRHTLASCSRARLVEITLARLTAPYPSCIFSDLSPPSFLGSCLLLCCSALASGPSPTTFGERAQVARMIWCLLAEVFCHSCVGCEGCQALGGWGPVCQNQMSFSLTVFVLACSVALPLSVCRGAASV